MSLVYACSEDVAANICYVDGPANSWHFKILNKLDTTTDI